MSFERALVALGYSESESLILNFLLDHKEASPKELIDNVSLSKGTVYKTLGLLEKKGAIFKINERPAVYAISTNLP